MNDLAYPDAKSAICTTSPANRSDDHQRSSSAGKFVTVNTTNNSYTIQKQTATNIFAPLFVQVFSSQNHMIGSCFAEKATRDNKIIANTRYQIRTS